MRGHFFLMILTVFISLVICTDMAIMFLRIMLKLSGFISGLWAVLGKMMSVIMRLQLISVCVLVSVFLRV